MLLNVGLDVVALNPDGPLHAYTTDGAVPVSPDERLTVPPTHAGPSLPAATAIVLITTVVVPVAEQPDDALLAITV